MTTLVIPLEKTEKNHVFTLELSKDNTIKSYMLTNKGGSKYAKSDRNIILDILENFQFSIRVDDKTLSQIYDNQLRKESIQIRIFYLHDNSDIADRLKKILKDRCEEMSIPVSITTSIKEVELV